MSENNTTAVTPATDEQIEARLKIELEKIKATVPEATGFSVGVDFTTWTGISIQVYAIKQDSRFADGSKSAIATLDGWSFHEASNTLRHRWDTEEAKIKAEAAS